MKKKLLLKQWGIIKNSKLLRTLSLLCFIFFLNIVVALSFSYSYHQKTKANVGGIKKNEETLISLQRLIEQAPKIESESNLFKKKSFVGYDEVIPFIALLESLFSVIDPKAELTIKSREEQIFIDHFADYKLNVKINRNKELFFRALDELYNSRFITKVMSFTMHYKPNVEGKGNELTEVEFIVRLFLN